MLKCQFLAWAQANHAALLPGAAGKDQIEAWLLRSTASAQADARSEVIPR